MKGFPTNSPWNSKGQYIENSSQFLGKNATIEYGCKCKCIGELGTYQKLLKNYPGSDYDKGEYWCAPYYPIENNCYPESLVKPLQIFYPY